MPKTYLCHYGIKGQKWGIRRFENEDGTLTPEGIRRYGTVENFKKKINKKTFNDEKKNVASEYSKKYGHQKEIDSLLKESYKLAEKYNLDYDDGGGGDGSKEARKAGQKYLELQEKAYELEENDDIDTDNYVNKYMIQKYGQKKVSEMKRKQNAANAAYVTGVLAFYGGLTILAIKGIKALKHK